jgi:hypothetical protein
VVVGQHEHVPPRAEGQQCEAKQRRPAEIEAAHPVLLEDPRPLSGSLGFAECGQIVLGPGRLNIPRYTCTALPDEV